MKDLFDPFQSYKKICSSQCCGAGTFWSEPVWSSGSGSTLDKADEILNDILFVGSTLIKGCLKNKYVYKYKFSIKKGGMLFKKKKLWLKAYRYFL